MNTTAVATAPADTPRSLRVRCGLSQQDLADMTVRADNPVDVRTIRNIESGLDCKTSKARVLATCLRVSLLDYLAALEVERERRKARS